jgi:poly(hydroxyalkanoate) depolymerase family esterase
MNTSLKADMKEATRLTGEGRLREALALLRGAARAKGFSPTAPSPDSDAPATKFARLGTATSAMGIGARVDAKPRASRSTFPGVGAGGTNPGDVLPDRARFDSTWRPDRGASAERGVSAPVGARYEERAFGNAAGERTYKIYIPAGHAGEPLPLVVMLHGCTQSPDDFALGTRMNDVAEERRLIVVYPAQSRSANASKCWNWFKASDQQREGGEPSMIAGITREVIRDFGVDASKVYVAGLSAGGAAAAVLGMTYPDIFAAIGVHSGLACGAASDIPSALAAMQQGARGFMGPEGGAPTIVFHGDRDKTVNSVNGDQVMAQSNAGGRSRVEVRRGETAGVSFTRTTHVDADGRSVVTCH